MSQNGTIARETPSSPLAERYSVFTRRQKNCIIGFAALGGWFSSVSSFVYFPAIPFLASDLHVSIQKVNLTVTAYLIMSGIFPTLMGNAADRLGRRPVFLAALAVYLGANIGLALQSHFAVLFVLRMLQSAGISGTFSIAYGVLGDLLTPAERGGYSGVMAFFLNTPPSLGPVISGLLLLRWTWRSIFWFLAATSSICLTLMAAFLPETARTIVGNGSTTASGVNRAFSRLLTPKEARRKVDAGCSSEPLEHARRRSFPNPLAALGLLRIPGTALVLVAYGINYTVYSCLQASLSTLFVDMYRLSGFAAGLVYLPFGVAVAFSALTTGRLLDASYKKTAAENGIPIVKNVASDLTSFPIEQSRLRAANFSIPLSALFTIGYGWALRPGVSMAVPLVLQFFLGVAIQVVFTSLNTLLVDLHPDCPSTAQAACNFIRCEMAAACLAALDGLLGSIGPGWTFSVFGAALFLEFLMLFLLQRKGMAWRGLGPGMLSNRVG